MYTLSMITPDKAFINRAIKAWSRDVDGHEQIFRQNLEEISLDHFR